MIPPDAELIRRVVSLDDRGAFGELVRRHQSAVRHFLRPLLGGDHALADDVAQETFLTAYRRLPTFRGEAAFSTWLLGIAHRHSCNARRRQRPTTPLAEAPPLAADTDDNRAAELRHDLDQALQQLAPEARAVVHLHYRQGLTHEEITAVLDLPLGTVKSHLARSKETLRRLLAAWNPSSP